jgi:branched-chain amino acid transport system permease protein
MKIDTPLSTDNSDYLLYRPAGSVREKVVIPMVYLVVLVVLVLAPLFPIFDFTGVFAYSTSYGRGNMGLVLVYAISVMGFGLLIGWGGQVGLAQAGVFGLGAYLTTDLFSKGVPFPVALMVSALVAALVGIAIGFPAARLKGFFLAIATLAFGELLAKLMELDIVGGAWLNTGGGGGRSVPPLRILGMQPSLSAYYASLAVFVLTAICMIVLTRGRFGRTLKAVRDIEVATSAVGISATKYKLLAFGLCSAAGALGGGLFALNATYLNPGAFRTNLLFFFLIILIIGGVRWIWGPLLGSIFFVVLRDSLQDSIELSNFIFGAALLGSILLLPGGIASLPQRLSSSKFVKDVTRRVWKLGR